MTMDEIKQKILVVDDEEDIRRLLKDYFEIQGFLVYTAESGEEAIQKINVSPDLILLDINMPVMNGIHVCKKIRNYVHVPIIFLTARTDEDDKIKGLMSGGDDYITKPFSIDELGARIAAHLRREQRNSEKEIIMIAGDFAISYSERKVYYQTTPLKLTKTEFDIIEILSMNKGRIFSKETVYEHLWGYDKDGDSEIITEHIRRIRNKFKKYNDMNPIETVWGVGYKWAA